jgi:hypothetical protein
MKIPSRNQLKLQWFKSWMISFKRTKNSKNSKNKCY